MKNNIISINYVLAILCSSSCAIGLTEEVSATPTPHLKEDISSPSTISIEEYQKAYPTTKSEMLTEPIQRDYQIKAQREEDLTTIKNELKVDPLVGRVSRRRYPPSLIFAGPSSFGPGWGDVFISAAGATAGNRDDVDGSLSAGFGIGDAAKAISVGLTYNMGSIKNFGDTGTFDLQASRILYSDERHQVAFGVGWEAFAQHVKGEQLTDSGVWGGLTNYYFLQPDNDVNKMPISLSLGVGGGNYRQGGASTGVFGNVGVQVAPQVGIGVGWSGVGLNVGMSLVPVSTIPLTIVATGADLTDNSPGGTVFALSVNYGFNFTPRQ